VILAQAGLELMTWLRLVSDGVLGQEASRKLDAADALRVTLELAGIDLAVPSAVVELFAATRRVEGQSSELDGPGAVVELRNGTIHPKPLARLGEDVVMEQGGRLAIRFLEMLLLHRLGYVGDAYNRTNWISPELVPWG
jgi:hypothetical protein